MSTENVEIQELIGHTSPETAYVVSDYPYGFRLRTEIRYWIETKRGHGQRVMSQTRNPKKPGHPWNKPKGSTYTTIRALYLDPATGHVENSGINGYSDEAEIRAWVARFPLTCTDERNRKAIEVLVARARVGQRITYSIVGANEPRQSPEEQAAILHKLTAIELHKLRTENQS